MNNRMLYTSTQMAIRARARREAILDIDTTIARGEGGTDSAAGSNPNAPVPGQTAQDAGRAHTNPSVHATRGPGEPLGSANAGKAVGIQAGLAASSSNTGKTESGRAAQRTVAGLNAGNFVKVIDRKTNQQVDKGIVFKVSGHSLFLKGSEEYNQDKYEFVRIA